MSSQKTIHYFFSQRKDDLEQDNLSSDDDFLNLELPSSNSEIIPLDEQIINLGLPSSNTEIIPLDEQIINLELSNSSIEITPIKDTGLKIIEDPKRKKKETVSIKKLDNLTLKQEIAKVIFLYYFFFY